jgi:hypothetical protein
MSLNRTEKKITLRRLTYNGKDYLVEKDGKLYENLHKYNIYDNFLAMNGELYKVGNLFISQNGRKKIILDKKAPTIFSSAKSMIKNKLDTINEKKYLKNKLDTINEKKYLEWAHGEFAPGGPGFNRLVEKYTKIPKKIKSLSLKKKSNSQKLSRKLKTI